MKASCEISFYPLTENYKELIISFIETVKEQHPEVRVDVTGLSTLLVGEWTALMEVMNQEVHDILEREKAVFVMKWAGGDHNREQLPERLK